jgi:hypothetical protein
MSMATASQTTAQVNGEKTTTAGNDIIAEKVDAEARPEGADNEESAIFPVTIATLIFQFVMLFTSLYCGMLFTNWGDAVINGEVDGTWGAALFSTYSKIIAQWVTLALFTLSVTLSLCCPDRIL